MTSSASMRRRNRVLLVSLAFLLSSCVSLKKHRADVDAAFKAGQAQHAGFVEDALNATSAELAAAKERLKKFHQLDGAGKLRPPKCPNDGRHQVVNGVCVDLEGK